MVRLREKVGMVFEARPFQNRFMTTAVQAFMVLPGPKQIWTRLWRKAFKSAGLLEEVKDRLNQPGTGLSGGQQQRLCIARAIAVSPMDPDG